MPRIACILVDDFPVAAILRVNPELRGNPVALSAGLEGHAELTCVSMRAKGMGVCPGMTVAQARALTPSLAIVNPSEAAERSAHDAILDAAESFSPIVEDGNPGCAYADLAGLTAIHGTEDEMAAELAHRIVKVGMDAAIGIASSKEVANLAARCGGMRIIPAEKEREFLDWIPLDVLHREANDRDDLELTLARWGIRRLGELARIDIRALGSRLGARGVELARLARGESRAPFVPRSHSEIFAEAIELDYGIEMLEPLNFVMRPMIERLVARLDLRGMVAGDITLSLGLSGGIRDDRQVAVAAPTNEVRSILALIVLSLEASPPPAVIETIRIAVAPRIPRPSQTDMFLPPSPAPDRLQTTIARLTALCGPDRVGTLMPVNSWRPEAVEVVPFDPPSLALLRERASGPAERPARVRVPEEEYANVAQLIIRAVRPAEEVEVMCTRGIPEFIRGTSVCARVVSLSGPWRREGEWWHLTPLPPSLNTGRGEQAGPFARNYYDVALADGCVYRMFCDLRSQKWFVDGIYD